MPTINPFVLKKLRNAKRWSQEQLAEKARVDKQTIWRIEHRKLSASREYTIRQLANALDCEEHDLTVETLPKTRESEDATLSRVDFEVSTLARNALFLVAERYFVPQSTILEVAPLLFWWAAEASLHRRRERLKQAMRLFKEGKSSILAEDNASAQSSEQELQEELESIEMRDVFAMSRDVGPDENPLETFLSNLVRDIDEDSSLETLCSWDYPEYRICAEDATHYTDGDKNLAEEILSGHVRLHEIPREIRDSDSWEERARWVRRKAEEHRRYVQRLIRGSGKEAWS